MKSPEDIARAWSSHVWLSAWEIGDPGASDAGAYTHCDVCEQCVGPSHAALAHARSAACLAEISRRGIENGSPIPADVLAMDEAPEGFDAWPDALSIEHDEDCPVGAMLRLSAALRQVR